MPLQPQRAHIPFSGGINEKIAREVIDGPDLLLVQNGRREKSGPIQKRFGYGEIGTGGLPGSPRGETLLVRGDELCQIVGESDVTPVGVSIYRYDDASGRWYEGDQVPAPHLHRIPVQSEWVNAVVRFPQVAINGDLMCVIYEDADVSSPTIWAHVTNRHTDTLLSRQGFSVPSGLSRPRVIAVGDFFVLLYVDGSDGDALLARKFDVTAPNGGWGASTEIGDDTAHFDAAPQHGLGTFVIVVSVGTGEVAVARYDTDFVQQSATANIGSASNNICAIMAQASSNAVIATWNDVTNTQISAWIADADLSNPITGIVVHSSDQVNGNLCAGARDSGSVWIVWDSTELTNTESAVNINGMRWRGVTIATGAVDATVHENGFCSVASTPFAHDGQTYLCVVPGGTGMVGALPQQAGLAIVELGNALTLRSDANYRARPVAQWMMGEWFFVGNSFNERTTFVSALAAEEDGGIVAYAAFRTQEPTFLTMLKSTRVEVARVNFEPRPAHAHAEALDGLLVASALPSNYDGRLCAEYGWLYGPWISSANAITGGSWAGGTTTFFYRVVFEHRDRLGRIARSVPSPAVSVEVDDTERVQLTLSPYTLTSREDTLTSGNPVTIALYRSTDGINYERVYVGLGSALTPNDRLATTYITVIDGLGTENAQAPLYTDGGVLEAGFVPPARHVSVWNNRWWLVSTSDPKTIWYSQELVQGDLAWFNEALQIRVDDGGDVIATAALDASLVVFKADRLFFLQGTGPNDAGAGGSFTEPQSIASDVGCIDAASIVLTPAGLMFQSERGIYLLNRGLSVSYIGAPVEDTLEAFPVITSAVLVRDQNEVRFTCMNAAGTAGRILTYNLLFEQWFVQLPNGSNARAPAAGAYVGDRHHWLRSNGMVSREVPDTYGDEEDGELVSYSFKIRTPHYKLDGLQGFARLWRATFFGRKLGDCAVTIRQSTRDYSDAYSFARSWTEAQVTAIAGSDTHCQFPIHLARQTGQSFSFELEDNGGVSQSATTGYVGFGIEEDSTLTITAGGTPYVFQYDFDGGGVLPGRIQFGVGASTNEQISQSLAAAIAANAATLPFTADAVLDAERPALIAEHPEFTGYEGVIIGITADDPGAIVYSAAMSIMAGTLIEVWTVGGTVLAGTAAMAWTGVQLEFGVERGTGRFDAARKR